MNSASERRAIPATYWTFSESMSVLGEAVATVWAEAVVVREGRRGAEMVARTIPTVIMIPAS
jgi:hypothetical protein